MIVFRAVDDNGIQKDHCHSVVIDANKFHGMFNLYNLITFLEGSEMVTLNTEFEKSGYVP